MSDPTTPPAPAARVPLAKDHENMRVSAVGFLNRYSARGARMDAVGREWLDMLRGHLEVMATRFYAGDLAVVDEFLQLYALDKDRRPAAKERNATLAAPGARVRAAMAALLGSCEDTSRLTDDDLRAAVNDPDASDTVHRQAAAILEARAALAESGGRDPRPTCEECLQPYDLAADDTRPVNHCDGCIAAGLDEARRYAEEGEA